MTTSLHRLVSIVELVKREYTKAIDAEAAEDAIEMAAATGKRGKKRKRPSAPTVPRQLHQYNELLCLERLGLLPSETLPPDEAALNIVREGRKRPRKTHTPALQITLSTKLLPEETEKRDVTCVCSSASLTGAGAETCVQVSGAPGGADEQAKTAEEEGQRRQEEGRRGDGGRRRR